MLKKFSVFIACGLVSLSLASPFAPLFASAELPPNTLATNSSIIDWVGLTTVSGTSTYYGENTVVNGVFGVMSTKAGNNGVDHSTQSVNGTGSASSNNIAEKTIDGRYSIVTVGNEWQRVRFYFNGFTLPELLFDYTDWEFEFITDETSVYIAYSSYMAWFPVADTEETLRVRGTVVHAPSLGNIRTRDQYTALIDFDYPTEIYDYDVIYMQYWIEFYTIANGPVSDNSYLWALRSPDISRDYLDYGDYRTRIGLEFYHPPLTYDFIGIIVENVESFLQFEIFPNFTFYNVLYLVFAVTFFGFILRAFLGG